MKVLFAALSLAMTVVVVGCSTTSSTLRQAPPAPASRVPSVGADILVVSAVYGSGTKFADVTYRVNDLLHQGDVVFFARPEWLMKDPTPGWNKALVIVYDYQGRRCTFTAGEGGRVSSQLLVEQAAAKLDGSGRDLPEAGKQRAKRRAAR